jgi:nitroreductase
MLADLIKANRSCRRFDESHAITIQTLLDLIDLGRLSASAANLQPLKYIAACNTSINAQIFRCLTWAAYLQTWPGPVKGERPAGYIVVLHDTAITQKVDCDHGIACQSILLGAREKGLAGCMLGAIKRNRLKQILNIADHLKILLVVAIGKPKETVVLETVDTSGSIRYFQDDQQIHHVPKRPLDEIVIARYDAD